MAIRLLMRQIYEALYSFQCVPSGSLLPSSFRVSSLSFQLDIGIWDVYMKSSFIGALRAPKIWVLSYFLSLFIFIYS